MSLTKEQTRKYDVVDGKIVNRTTGKAIPEDEPIFILRAQDLHFVTAMEFYASCCRDREHQAAVKNISLAGQSFRGQHIDRMKEPDTEIE